MRTTLGIDDRVLAVARILSSETVSSNQRVTPEARTPAEAAYLPELLCSRSGYAFLEGNCRA
jgi:hypothetical protein